MFNYCAQCSRPISTYSTQWLHVLLCTMCKQFCNWKMFLVLTFVADASFNDSLFPLYSQRIPSNNCVLQCDFFLLQFEMCIGRLSMQSVFGASTFVIYIYIVNCALIGCHVVQYIIRSAYTIH